MRLRNLVLTLLAASWLPIAHAMPGPHEHFEVIGNVIKNHDGDTLKLLTADHGIIVVRLSGADTPETGQAYWKAARDNLHEMVAGKPVDYLVLQEGPQRPRGLPRISRWQ